MKVARRGGGVDVGTGVLVGKTVGVAVGSETLMGGGGNVGEVVLVEGSSADGVCVIETVRGGGVSVSITPAWMIFAWQPIKLASKSKSIKSCGNVFLYDVVNVCLFIVQSSGTTTLGLWCFELIKYRDFPLYC